MADLRAFRAYRYAPEVGKIEDLIYLMSDSISEKKLQELQSNPYSSIHFSKSRGRSPLPAGELIRQWIENKILVRDTTPGIYVWYQYYISEEKNKKLCRKAFVANVRLQDWKDKIILPHENIIDKSLSNKQDFIAATGVSFAPIQALYSDPEHTLESYMNTSIRQPLYEFNDGNGVDHKVSVIRDPEIIQMFVTAMQPKVLIVADGHHRYHAALEYRNQQRELNPNISADAPWNFTNMFLMNADDPDIEVKAFHRTFQYSGESFPENLTEILSEHFEVTTITQEKILMELEKRPYSCVLLSPEKSLFLTLKPEFQDKNVIYIDLIYQYLVDKDLKKAFKNLNIINFSFNFNKILQVNATGTLQFTLVLKPTTLQEIKQVCFSGGIMPEKSTYFYPKLMAGLLFNSVKAE